MASADLREELNCSICLEVYTDPVTLRCGHNFCRLCINEVLDSQRPHGGFTCPQCRARFKRRPWLQKNVTLSNIAEHFRCAPPCEKEGGTFCTYCIHAAAPAAKSCLHCEASLCADHLRVHSKSPEHILIEPSNSLEDWKCPIHKKVLDYYCIVDCSVICVLCMQEAKHQGHAVQTVHDASAFKMEKLQNAVKQFNAERQKNDEQIRKLQEGEDKASAAGARALKRVASVFQGIREELAALEERTAEDIAQQLRRGSKAVVYEIQLLEIKNHVMSCEMARLQEFCQVTDPMAILQDREWNGDYCVPEKGGDGAAPAPAELDEVLLSLQLQRDLSGVLSGVPAAALDVPQLSNIRFDGKTAAPNVALSCDLAMAHGTPAGPGDEEDTGDGLDSRRVLGTTALLAGRHYWEVELWDTSSWRIGMAYKVGGNVEQAWCLCRGQKGYFFQQEGNRVPIPKTSDTFRRLGIYVDCKGGRLSFYEMEPEVSHVHTVHTVFTRPLFPAVWVGCGAWVKIIR